jgi:hypothetical protein
MIRQTYFSRPPNKAPVRMAYRKQGRLPRSTRKRNFIRRGRLSGAVSVTTLLATLVGIFLGCTGCARQSSAFTLDIETLRHLSPEDAAGIAFEEDEGVLLVTVTDKYGDSHIHRLSLEGSSRAKAIELLGQKQLELQRRK